MQYKSLAFKKFLEFISLAENPSEKKLIKYYTNGGREFNNKAFKSWCLECGVQ